MFASLLKGLDFEEAIILALILGVLMLGRRAFYRPTAILSERFTPVWVASILGVIAMAVWIGIVSHRQVGYSDQLWWTFALHGNAGLSGDKRLLFSEAGDAFVMYQIAGSSWIALGDPVGSKEGAEELVWRLREISDHHGGQTVFYQVGAERLALYVDLGLAALKIGEEARVPLAEFSLEGATRAELRQAHRRAQRDGASFEVVPAEG